MKNRIVFGILVIIAINVYGGLYFVFQYSKTHHRDAATENAIVIPATQIVNDFHANEKRANLKYLNKVVQISGTVLKQGKDQAKNTTVTIKSGDPFANIFCTLKSRVNLSRKDSVIVVKGICSGFLSDVILNDAVVMNKGKIRL
ncbi:MAG: OB-fold putative lipoprotein [Bacteroidota bacterium]|nr:OB-fold putative lipoprotein [Bacteroidota bacterium]